MPDKKNPREDYKVMVDMVKEAEEQLNLYKDILENSYEADHISMGRSKFLFDAYTVDELKKMDDDIAEEALLKIRIPDGPMDMKDETEVPQSKEEWIKNLCEEYYKSKNNTDDNVDTTVVPEITEPVKPFDEVYKEERFNLIRDILVKFKEDFLSLEESEKNVQQLKDETTSVIDQYSNYMCSTEYEEKQKNTIEKMRKRIEEERKNGKTYEVEKMSKKVDVLEKIIDGSFITERLESIGEKEVKNIVNTYFNSNKSSYIIERFKDKIEKVGFNSNAYRFFFNIEEKYLPEEYQVFNNLYLFIVMRFIAYININSEADRSYVRSIISSISKLVYEKYDDENKEKYIDSIKKCLDYFSEYKDKFNEDNYLHPNHPRRIERDKQRKEEERNIMLKTLELNNYPITDELKEMDFKELKETYTKILDDIEKSKKDKELGDIDEFIQKTKKETVSSVYGEMKNNESEDTNESND